MISDNIPIFNEYPAPNELKESKKQLLSIYRIIKEFNAKLTLNQAFLLKEYESNLRGTLHNLLEEMYNESLSCGLTDNFFTDWVITQDHIQDLNIDSYKLKRFYEFQNQYKLIQDIKAISKAGGCNCETI